MSLTQGDVGQRHESVVGEVRIGEGGFGCHLEGVVVDDQEAPELRGGGLDRLKVRGEAGRFLGRNGRCILLWLRLGLDDGADQAGSDEVADQWLKDTSASRGGY